MLDDSIPMDLRADIASGLERVEQIIRSNFLDEVSMQVEIRWKPLSGLAANATVNFVRIGYYDVRHSLLADQTSVEDGCAYASLPQRSTLPLYMNFTSDNPNGTGSPQGYLNDNQAVNNRLINLTVANAKAIGYNLSIFPDTDGIIEFDSNDTWDFDPSDGIDAGAYNFLAVALHEMGHVMGALSRQEFRFTRDPNQHSSAYYYVALQDVFRYSRASVIVGGVGTPDYTADPREKFFSIDGGLTPLARFATGSNGDGISPSHWESSPGFPVGLMDTTPGSLTGFSYTRWDAVLFDVLGWDRAGKNAVPQLRLTFTDTGVQLDWDARTGAEVYRVERATLPELNFAPVTEWSAQTQWFDPNPLPGMYRLVADATKPASHPGRVAKQSGAPSWRCGCCEAKHGDVEFDP